MKDAEMEKRRSERLPMIQDVIIVYRSLGLVKGKAVDISLGGISIDIGPVNLPEHAPVSVRFKLASEQGTQNCEAHAIVIRQNSETCCLMFDGMDMNTHRALRSLVGDWHILPQGSGISSRAIAG